MNDKQMTLDDLFEQKEIETVFIDMIPVENIRARLSSNHDFPTPPTAAFKKNVATLGVNETILIEVMDDESWTIRSGKRRFLSAEESFYAGSKVCEKIPARGIRGNDIDGLIRAIAGNYHRAKNTLDDFNHLVQIEQEAQDREIPYTDKELAAKMQMKITDLRRMRRVSRMPDSVIAGVRNKQITITNADKLRKLPPKKREKLYKRLRNEERVTKNDIEEQQRVAEREFVNELPIIEPPTLQEIAQTVTEGTNPEEIFDRFVESLMSDEDETYDLWCALNAIVSSPNAPNPQNVKQNRATVDFYVLILDAMREFAPDDIPEDSIFFGDTKFMDQYSKRKTVLETRPFYCDIDEHTFDDCDCTAPF